MVRRFDFSIISITAFYVFCFCVFAAEEEMDEYFSMSPSELANITISIATGTATPAYQSASVISVITSEQIKTMGATELTQVLETVPGLHVSNQAVTNDPIYSMRGIRNEINNQVLVMLNGTRFSVPYKGSSMTYLELPVEAIQQIEIIRGPGSALYGADAFAGVINIITKKAKDIDGTELGVRVGSWDTQSAWGLHSNHWLGWDVAAILQYVHNNNDQDRVIKTDAQSIFDTAFNTKASNAPGEMQTKMERWDAHLNLKRKYWDIKFWAFNRINGGLKAGLAGALDKKGKADGENYLTDLRFSTEDTFEEWEVQGHASYLYTDLETDIHVFPKNTVLPIDGNGNINPSNPFVLSPTSFPDGMNTLLGIENQVVSFEMNTLYKGFEHHLLRMSAEFRYEQVKTKESRNFGKGILDGSQAVVSGDLTDITGTDLVFLSDSNRSIWSLALQDEWQIHQDWLLTAGIRYDEYSDFGSTFNPRLALVWSISEQLTGKLLYGQAFRAPSFLEQKQKNSQFFVGNPNLEPETIETIELALDYRPQSDLRISSNFYYYNIEDLILIDLSGGNIPVAVNSKGQKGIGLEFEWDWKFHKKWSFKGNYAWQYARNGSSNRRVDGVPEHQLYVATAWHVLPQWQLQTQLNWIGHRLNAEASTNNELKDYATVDVTLNSHKFFETIDFSASVRNVFDSHGKEPAVNSYPENLPIPSRSFYIETTVYF